MISDPDSFDKLASNKEALVFPPDFGRRFAITVDTEEEFDWDGPFQRKGHTTISVPKLERFQNFIEKFSVKPCYFVDYSIIEDDLAAAFLKECIDKKNADVGLHLHPWVNPPASEELNDRNSFAGNLPPDLERAKLYALRDRIEERTGHRPTLYRAGRYGIGPNTPEILRELGVKLDSSIRSRYDYSHESGPDFTHFDSQPFWLKDEQKVLEIPLTTIMSGVLRKHHGLVLPLMNGNRFANALFAKAKIAERIPLTPEGVSVQEAKEAIDIALDDGLSLLVFSFHSPSLSIGHTPYVKNRDDLDGLYDWWRAVLGHLQAAAVHPISLGEMAETLVP